MDSILFLISARLALKESISISNIDQKRKKNLFNFVMKEATDYQIMSLLVNESLPTEKQNPVKEEKLFTEYKNIVLENYDDFTNILGEQIVEDLLVEVGPLTDYGFSSSLPILEQIMLAEDDPYKEKLLKQMMDKKVGDARKTYHNIPNTVIDTGIHYGMERKQKKKSEIQQIK